MAEFLSGIFRISLFGSLAAGLLLLLRPLLSRLAGWSAVYYLWLLVLVRFCLPAGVTVTLPAVFHSLAVNTESSAAGDSLFASNPAAVQIPQAEETGRMDMQGEAGGLSGAAAAREEADDDAAAQGEAGGLSGRLDVQREPEEASGQAAVSAGTAGWSGQAQKLSWLLHGAFLWQNERIWMLLWAFGASAYLIWHMWASLHFARRVRASFTEADIQAQEVLKESEPSGRIGLAESDMADTPMLLGFLRPVIVLPKGLKGNQPVTKDMLRDIVKHELVHAGRHDIFYKWFVTAAAALHWFNPLMILIRREISRSCELSCDETVIRGMSAAQRRHYGETLLAMAGAASSKMPGPAAALSEEKAQLKERLVTIAGYRKKGICAVLLSLLPVLAVSGCAVIYDAQTADADHAQTGRAADIQTGSDADVHTGGIQTGSTEDAQTDGTGDSSQSGSAGSGQGNGTGHVQTPVLTEEAADDYLAVLTDRKQLLYYAEDNGSAEPLNLTKMLDLFSPDSSFVQIYEFAVVDLDGDKEAEVLLHITDVAGDLGGFMILQRSDGRVRGFKENYKCFSDLKTDGTFCYTALARPDDGIGTVRFRKKGCSVVPLAFSETSEDFQTVTYQADGKQISEEEYQDVLKRQKDKTDAAWYRFTDDNIYGQLMPAKETEHENPEPELFYEKDGRQYELVQDLVTGRYLWAGVTALGDKSERERQEELEKQRKLGNAAPAEKGTDYNAQEHYFEKLDHTQAYQVRRWDNLLYSAGEYLVFEYNGTIHVSKSTDLYHPVLSYDYGGTYGIITKVPDGYMTADDKSYEIHFYDEQFRETKVITGLRAGESGHYYENGLMAVRDMDTGLIGYIDKKGVTVIPCSYAIASDFSNGFASVLTGARVVQYTEDAGTVKMFYGIGGQWGIIDRKGEFVLKPCEKYANESPGSQEEQYSSGVRRFGPVREDGTADFIAQDEDEKVLETVDVW